MSRSETLSVLDLFAGPGGWDIAAQRLGHDPLGVEWDDAACETRKAAGLRTLQGNVAELDPCGFGDIDLLIASPPCQAWSMAGKRLGEKDKQHVIACAHELAMGHDRRNVHAVLCEDGRSMLVVEPLRFIRHLKPTYVALEQVPPVLELWTLFASFLEQWGYSVWTGVLEAERYGVPQTRERAILIASLNGPVAPPEPTHQRYIPGEPQRHDITFDGEVLPWVSMAEALGWTSGTITANNTTSSNGEGRVRQQRTTDSPAQTVGKRVDMWERLPAYRRTRGEGLTERNGERRDHPPTEPAPAVTSKARSDEWVYDVRAGGHAVGYTRDCENPAPTLTAAGLATGRDVIRPKKALRANKQENSAVRAEDEPAPTITGGHDTGDRVWVEDERPKRKLNASNGRERTDGGGPVPRAEDEPAFTLTGEHHGQARWVDERPAPTIVTTRRSDQGIVVGRQLPEGEGRNVGGRNWGGSGPQPDEAPATTVAGDPRLSSRNHHNHGEQNGNAVRVTEQEAAILQSFPPNYPFQGSRSKRFEQIGNAVPPLLAEAILLALLDMPAEERKAA